MFVYKTLDLIQQSILSEVKVIAWGHVCQWATKYHTKHKENMRAVLLLVIKLKVRYIIAEVLW